MAFRCLQSLPPVARAASGRLVAAAGERMAFDYRFGLSAGLGWRKSKWAALSLIWLLAAKLSAEWEVITTNLPDGFDQPAPASDGGAFFTTPIFGGPALGPLVTDATQLMVSTVGSIYISNDNGESFTDTEPPFDPAVAAGAFSLSATPRYRTRLQYAQGSFCAIAQGSGAATDAIILYHYAYENQSWHPRLTLVSEADPVTHGAVQFYTQALDSSAHFVLTGRFDPIEHRHHNFLWRSTDGENWELRIPSTENSLADPLADPLLAATDLFWQAGKLFLRSGAKLYESADEGLSWTKIYDSEAAAGGLEPYTLSWMPLGDDDSETSSPGGSVFFSRELGWGRHLHIIDPLRATAARSWLPGVVDLIAKEGALFLVAGWAPSEAESPTRLYFSSTRGESWDPLDTAGLTAQAERSSLDSSSPLISPGGPEVTSLQLTATHAYLVLNNTELWRRPLSELDLVASTSIVREPQHLIASAGSSGSIEVFAVGSGALAYQWLKNGVELPGATESVVHFDSLSSADRGLYKVSVTGAKGSLESREIKVDLATSFEAYAQHNFPAGLREPDDDARGDGQSNLTEYLFGLAGSDARPRLELQAGTELGMVDDRQYLTLSFARRLNAADFSISARAAELLEDLPSGHQRAHRIESTLEGDFERITYRTDFSVGESPSGFLQLMIEANEGDPSR